MTRDQQDNSSDSIGGGLHPAIIAIDGPAASGKSTAGYRLANALDFLFFDTGVMYRAVTWAALARSVAIDDEPAIGALAHAIAIDIRPPQPDQQDGRHATVLVDGQDVTWLIRAPEVDRTVSTVSAYPEVRKAMTAKQRQIAHRYGRGDADRRGIVMVGRDIGTVVMPDALLKLYVDATPEERARRRHHELVEQGKTLPYAQVLADIVRRDRIDSERELSPLRPAEDAIRIDNSNQSADETLAQALDAVQRKAGLIVKVALAPDLAVPDLEIVFSPSEHNNLVAALIREFGQRFMSDADVLYIRDGDSTIVTSRVDMLRSLGMRTDSSDGYPDVILYSKALNWLYLIEVGITSGPIDDQRRADLADIFSPAITGLVFVTAFPDRSTMAHCLAQISWETTVWLADEPEHLIHFNGKDFLGPH
ncbi:MAG: (d)CMP kinase [Caldilinea sp.]